MAAGGHTDSTGTPALFSNFHVSLETHGKFLQNRRPLEYTEKVVTDVLLENSEATMLARAFDARTGDLPEAAARVLLRARLPDADMQRMVQLGERAQSGLLTLAERREAEAYDRVGLLIELLQSKARLSLKQHRS